MEYDNIWDKIKEYISKYSIYILVFLVILVLLILLIPRNNNNVTPTLTLTLKGNREVSIMKGENYIEAGYTAYDSIEGDITNRVTVIGVINKEEVGKYIIKYSITNKNGITKEEVRTINVIADLSDLSVGISYSPKEITNKDVTIELKISGTGYDFALDPDGNLIKDTKITYKASVNDEYIFSIKRKDGAIIEKIVNIENIDKVKPIGSCKNVITTGKTTITVSATDDSGIKKYSYTTSNSTKESTSNSYTLDGENKNAVVTVYDNAGNYEMINCITEDKTSSIKVTSHYQVSKYEDLNYIVYYPENLDLSHENSLVIFLHGDGERGTRISSLENVAFVQNMKSGKFKNAIYLAPQRPGEWYWNKFFPTLKKLINEIVKAYNVNTKKISITGHSSGGIGVYGFVSENPTMFAAASVLSGRRDKAYEAKALIDVPIRHYHGTSDVNVPFSSGERGVNEIKNAGGKKIELIPLEGKGHAIGSYVYNQTDVIEWMLSQSK